MSVGSRNEPTPAPGRAPIAPAPPPRRAGVSGPATHRAHAHRVAAADEPGVARADLCRRAADPRPCARVRYIARRTAWLNRSATLALAAVLMALALPAHAHRASITHATATVSSDQRAVSYRLQMDPPDGAELLDLAPDTDPDADTVARRQDRLFTRLFGYIEIRDGQTPCPPTPGQAEILQDGGRFLTATWEARCPAPITELVVEYRLFFDIDPLHRSLTRVVYRDQRALEELSPNRNRLVWELGAPPPQSGIEFVWSGVDHIAFGFDHIAFLISLLLIVGVHPRISDPSSDTAAAKTVTELRPLGAAIRDTAILVTSFTVAHSITLIAASLGWVAIDGRLVESAIAISIVYVAIENIIRPGAGYRGVITFAFGLIHGLGFASMLAVLLPPDDVVIPLLLFNLGVELGQFAIVLLIVPGLHLAARTLGGDGYRRAVAVPGSIVLAVTGTLWLLERVFVLTILGF